MSWAMRTPTERASPGSSAASTTGCAAAQPTQLSLDERRAVHPARRDRQGDRPVQRHRRHGHRHGRAHRRGPGDGVAAGFRPQRSRRDAAARRASTGPRSAPTRWARCSRSSPWRWRSTTSVTTLAGGYDATNPIHIGRFTIHDDHAQQRWLSVPEIFEYSSQYRRGEDGARRRRRSPARFPGTARAAARAAASSCKEVAAPLVPSPWRPVNTMTIGFGHGISVSPLQVATAVSAVVNGGMLHRPTLLKRAPGAARQRHARHRRRNLGRDAQAAAPRRRARHRQARRGAGLSRRRQDRHGREGQPASIMPRMRCSRPSSASSRSTIRAIWCWSASTSRTATSSPSASPPAAGSRRPAVRRDGRAHGARSSEFNRLTKIRPKFAVL